MTQIIAQAVPIPESIGFWEKVLLHYGPMWVLILAAIFGGWRIARYLAPYVKGAMESHAGLVDTLRQEIPKQTKAWQDTARASQASAVIMDEHQSLMQKVDERTARMDKGLGDVHRRLDLIIDRGQCETDG